MTLNSVGPKFFATSWFTTGLAIILSSITYRVVAALKKAENIDFYDVNTNFTPFSLEITEQDKP
jgi:hypothetical protein